MTEQEELEARLESLEQKRSGREQPDQSDAVTPWAEELGQIQKYFEDWNERGAEFDGATEWGTGLENLQDQFEARMQSRTNGPLAETASTSFEKSMVHSQRRFEEMDAANKARKQTRVRH